jgi:conjugal transfer ATP-binding protein TraC
MAMLKAIIGQMARPTTGSTIPRRAWSTARSTPSGRRGGRFDRRRDRALEATGHPQGEALAIGMRPFSSAGTYGKFFAASLKIGAALTVFELSDLPRARNCARSC